MPRGASKQLFITWSGPLSQGIALALREWLRLLFPTLELFVSTEDLRKGGNWSKDLSKRLTGAYRGIACITTDNFERPWLHFEMGALYASSKGVGVYSLIVDGLQDSMLAGNPISQFQHTRLVKADFSRLVRWINDDLVAGKRGQSDLTNTFSALWPKLVAELKKISSRQTAVPRPLHIADLAKNSPVLSSLVFENMLIKGPAVLALLEQCNFENCLWGVPIAPGSDMNSLIWKPSASYMAGAIGVSRCTFRRCSFENVGFTGPEAAMGVLRRVAKRPGAEHAGPRRPRKKHGQDI
jgi:hypothetical protein